MFLVLFASAAIGASYYVDYDAGDDSNAGTSTGAAFQHCPGDQQATGNADSATLSAGDTVYFKGGVTYVLTATNVAGDHTPAIDVSWSGTSGSRITYDGNSGESWGTGKAIITDNYGSNQLQGFATTVSRSNLTFRYFSMSGIGGEETLPTDPGYAVPARYGWGIAIRYAKNVTVQDCDFSKIGYYYNEKPMAETNIYGGGIGFRDAQSCLITNCTFTQMGWGLYLETESLTTNLTVTGCQFHDSIKWCMDLPSTTGAGASGAILVSNCQFYNFGQFGESSWSGYGEWPHVDGIFLRCDISGDYYSTNNDSTGINFVSNEFWDTNQLSANGTACIYLAGGTSANIYNNTFIHTIKSRTIFLGNGPANPTVARIYNNTFIEKYQIAIDAVNAGENIDTLDIRNNLFVDFSTDSNAKIIYFEQAGVADNLTIDYNCYFSSNTTAAFQWLTVLDGDFTDWQNQGYDAHGQWAWPTLTDLSYETGAQCNLNDLTLQSESAPRNSAIALSLFTDDHIGTERGGVWDQGAYEYIAGPGGNTNLVFQSLNMGNLQIGP